VIGDGWIVIIQRNVPPVAAAAGIYEPATRDLLVKQFPDVLPDILRSTATCHTARTAFQMKKPVDQPPLTHVIRTTLSSSLATSHVLIHP